jgi:Domain of unknown function (DUF6430)
MVPNTMRFDVYRKLLAKIGLKRIGESFVSNFGLLWLLLEPGALFFPEKLNFGWLGYFGLASVALIISAFQNLPRRSVSWPLSSPDSEIEIKIGDIFSQQSHLVIGFNDVFDTELGEVIRPSSLQGQFLNKVYSSDLGRLDADIEAALQIGQPLRINESNKLKGKTWRYPIGTTITLGTHDRRYFLTAYGYMNNDLTVSSDSDHILTALSSLWKEIRLKGHGMNVSIPIIGADLARTGLPRMALAKLIITSFIIASKEKYVTRKLTIMVFPADLDSVDFYELKDFLSTACF